MQTLLRACALLTGVPPRVTCTFVRLGIQPPFSSADPDLSTSSTAGAKGCARSLLFRRKLMQGLLRLEKTHPATIASSITSGTPASRYTKALRFCPAKPLPATIWPSISCTLPSRSTACPQLEMPAFTVAELCGLLFSVAATCSCPDMAAAVATSPGSSLTLL